MQMNLAITDVPKVHDFYKLDRHYNEVRKEIVAILSAVRNKVVGIGIEDTLFVRLHKGVLDQFGGTQDKREMWLTRALAPEVVGELRKNQNTIVAWSRLSQEHVLALLMNGRIGPEIHADKIFTLPNLADYLRKRHGYFEECGLTLSDEREIGRGKIRQPHMIDADYLIDTQLPAEENVRIYDVVCGGNVDDQRARTIIVPAYTCETGEHLLDACKDEGLLEAVRRLSNAAAANDGPTLA